MPEHLLLRTTKDHCDIEWYRGMREHGRQLAEWADTSHLVAAGVAEEDGLRRALLSPGLQIGGGGGSENTLGVEAWLRDVAAHPVPAYLTHTPRHPFQEPLTDSGAHRRRLQPHAGWDGQVPREWCRASAAAPWVPRQESQRLAGQEPMLLQSSAYRLYSFLWASS